MRYNYHDQHCIGKEYQQSEPKIVEMSSRAPMDEDQAAIEEDGKVVVHEA